MDAVDDAFCARMPDGSLVGVVVEQGMVGSKVGAWVASSHAGVVSKLVVMSRSSMESSGAASGSQKYILVLFSLQNFW